MCMHARMRRLVWSGDGTYVRRRRQWPARGKICACAFLVLLGERERAHLVLQLARAVCIIIPYSGYFSRGNIFVKVEILAISWKKIFVARGLRFANQVILSFFIWCSVVGFIQ